MSSFPAVPISNVFNTLDYNEIIDGSLSLADADARYFKISGGTVSGFSTFLNSLNVIGTLSINSSPVDLSLISGVTAGTPLASKVLSLDALSNINGNINIIGSLTVSTSVSTSIINSSSYLFSGAPMLASALTSITPGTATPSKALIADSNKNISGLNIISSNGIVLTPTTYNLSGPVIDGCLWRSNSSRISAFREIDTNNFSWGFIGGGSFNDVLIMSNSTTKITINGDFNLYGQLRSSGTVVLDSSQNLTVNDITATDITATTSITSPLAHIRNDAQTHNTRIEYLSLGRSSSGSDHGAWSLSNYYSSSTQGDSNYITFGPKLRTGLTTGWGMVMTQNGNVSFQDKNTNSGAGGFKIQANIVGTVDIMGGITRTIGAGHGYLQANSGSPAAYNASSVSTRISLYVENAIWTADKVYASSDIRLKRDIEPIPLDDSKKLLNVNAVSYRWKKDKFDNFTKSIGLIAQDVIENGLDNLVSYCPNDDKENFPLGYNYGIEYSRVPIYLLELIKDLYKQIDELKKI